jgi:transcriptional regulator GlxA family with amidase domain
MIHRSAKVPAARGASRRARGQQVSLARQLLETTDMPLDLVANRAGSSAAASLREHLRRRTFTTPSNYRRSFRDRVARSASR